MIFVLFLLVINTPIVSASEKYTMRVGESLELSSGYALCPKQIDVDNGKAWIELAKDGEYFEDKVMYAGDSWFVEDLDDTILFEITCIEVFQGQVDSLVVVSTDSILVEEVIEPVEEYVIEEPVEEYVIEEIVEEPLDEPVEEYLIEEPSYYWQDKGSQFFEAGNYADAIQAFDTALELDSYDYDLWVWKGIAHIKVGQYNNAISAFNRADNIDPNTPEVWALKGIAKHELGQYEDALYALNRAIDIDSDIAPLWYWKGNALLGLGQYEDAVDAFDIAVAIDPNYIDEFKGENIQDARDNALGMLEAEQVIEEEPVEVYVQDEPLEEPDEYVEDEAVEYYTEKDNSLMNYILPIGTLLILLPLIGIVALRISKKTPSHNKTQRPSKSTESLKNVPAQQHKPKPKQTTQSPTKATEQKNRISTKSAFSYKGATIIHKIKIENPTPEPISDIKVHLFVPEVFLLEGNKKSIPILEPGESKTVTFDIRPSGECGDCNVSGRVNYYDYGKKKRQEIDLETKCLSIICPLLHINEISTKDWRNTVSSLVRTEETTRDISMPAETLFNMASRVIEDMNMFMLEPVVTSTPEIFNGVARFYGLGIKNLKYAAQIEVVGGAKKAKIILKAWAEKEDALTGFYHGMLDELEKRVQVKGYINENMIQNFYHYGDNIGTQVKDSFVQRSNIGTNSKTCPQCNIECDMNEKFCSECGSKLE